MILTAIQAVRVMTKFYSNKHMFKTELPYSESINKSFEAFI